MTAQQILAVEVIGAEAGQEAEFILCRVLQSVDPLTPKRARTPAHVFIMLGTRAS